MNVKEAVAGLIGVRADAVHMLAKTAGEFRLELEGVKLGLSQPMVPCNNALLRVGRHLWSVTWNEKEFISRQLTEPGT